MSQMSNWIGIGVAVALGAAALLVAIFYPAPLNRSEQTISPYTSANPDVEPGRYTKAFVDAAIERYDDEGREATLAYYNSPESVDGQWYVFIADEEGRIVAHPTVKDNIGRSPGRGSGRRYKRIPLRRRNAFRHRGGQVG